MAQKAHSLSHKSGTVRYHIVFTLSIDESDL